MRPSKSSVAATELPPAMPCCASGLSGDDFNETARDGSRVVRAACRCASVCSARAGRSTPKRCAVSPSSSAIARRLSVGGSGRPTGSRHFPIVRWLPHGIARWLGGGLSGQGRRRVLKMSFAGTERPKCPGPLRAASLSK